MSVRQSEAPARTSIGSSRYSGSNDGGYAESSSQAGSRRSAAQQLISRDDHTPEPVEEQAEDTGRLRIMRRRMRRSGGFLLDSTLPKRREGGVAGSSGVKYGNSAATGIDDVSNGRGKSNGKDKGKEKTPGNSRLSTESSVRASPLSHEMRYNSSDPGSTPSRISVAGHDVYPDLDHDSGHASSHASGRHNLDHLFADSFNHSSDRSFDRLSGNSAVHVRGSLDGAEFDQRHLTPASQSQWQPQRQSQRQSPDRSQAPLSSQNSLDPAQLVNMALSLSEGRRRHASAGLSVPAVSADTRRVQSAGGPAIQIAPGSPLANDFLRPSSAGETPQHHFSRYPVHGVETSVSPPSFSHHVENETPAMQRRSGQMDDEAIVEDELQNPEDYIEFQFSAATINRAERVKKFFELASEYRRLLVQLPPLKPDSSAPGNFTFSTQPSPGNIHPQISRVRSNTLSKHDLGRQYNPLQLLRNRRIRHREQRPLDPQPDVFENVTRVKSYIDEVESHSSHAAYRGPADVVALPRFRRGSHSEDTPPPQITRTHKRTDTALSKNFRSIGDWSFTPAELFSDALWLEQSDNKSLIENRHGNKIFPTSDRMSLDSARDTRKSRDSDRPGLERSNTYASTVGTIGTAGTADEGNGKKARKKRKLLSLRHVDHAARKHIFRQRAQSPSSSDDSSSDRRKRPYLHKSNHSDGNVAPLDRHMRKLIEKERSTSAESPEVISPDKWNRSPEKSRKHSTDNLSFDGDGYEHKDLSKATHTRNSSSKTDEPMSPDDRGRPSFDDSTAPSSPNVPNFIPSFGMSLSPPQSRRSSPERRSGKKHANLKQTQKIQETDFATASQANAHAGDGELIRPQRSSFEIARPALLKRNKTSASVASERGSNHDRRGSKDTPVSRFFKGGRIGDLVRAESSAFGDVIWKRKAPKDANASDMSDQEQASADEEDEHPLKQRPTNISRTSTSDSDRARYYTAGLPTFKPQHAIQDEEKEPVATQQQLHRESSRSSRFERINTPCIQLPNDNDNTPLNIRKNSNTSTITDGRRGSDTLLSALQKNRSGNSAENSVTDLNKPNKTYLTALANAAASRRPSLQNKRHWSISDARTAQLEQEMQMVTAQDIARVRALFLASGVKAHELINRAHAIVDPSSEFLILASKMASDKTDPVEAKEEFVVAAKLLSRTITSTTDELRSDLEGLRSKRAPALHARFEELKHQVEEKLVPRIQATTDEAEAFNVEITTHQTLAVKQVNDAVDNILRSRRRHLRVLRRAGFAMLEWFVLGVLWVVWLIVIIIRAFRAIVTRTINGVRWCLWL